MKPAAGSTRGNWRLPAAISLALFSLTWLVFGQTVRFGFVNYDDPEWVTQNAHIIGGLTTSGIVWALQRPNAGTLASISHMLDVQMFGLSPAGHHFGNVLLHALAAVFLFLALRRMTSQVNSGSDSDWCSALVAALFAIHPLRAESVAWITERKDVLSGFFLALTLLAYVAYVRRGSAARYLALCFAFALGLLSKGTLMPLPLVLLLLDYWPLRRDEKTTWKSLIAEKAPLFALSCLAGFVTFSSHSAGLATVQAVPLPNRLTNAVINYFVYLRQMVWPSELAAFYPYREHPATGLVAVCFLSLVGISVAALLWRKRAPYLFTGWFWYLIMLAPISGIVQLGNQGHADRYTYLPQIGLYIVVAWALARLSRRLPRRAEMVGAVAAAVVILLALVAHQAAASWRDTETLWSHAIAVAPDNDFARASLADWLLREGRTKESVAQSEEALRINPRNADAHNNLALAISRDGRLAEAIEHWRIALEIQPENLNARCNLAWVLSAAPEATLRNGAEAIELVEPVARGTGGSNVTVLQILGAAYAEAGRFDDATAAAQKGLGFAERQGNTSLADSLKRMLASYAQKLPLRDDGLVSKSTVPPALARPR